MESKQTKILVVDDSDVILHSLRSFFEGYQFDVVTCIDGLEGIQMAAEFKPDLIFLDLMMPNFDGIKMLQVKSVLKDIKDIPVIVISANAGRKNVVAAMEAGAERVLSKPIEKEQMIKYVDELLGGSHFNEKGAKNKLTDSDNKEIKNQLVKFFIDSFPSKQQLIQSAIKNKNAETLKMTAHEIKGAGGTMGYDKISMLAKEIEEKEYQSPTDWVFAEFKLNEISQLVFQIKQRLNIN